MPTYSTTSIANAALLLCGASPVTSITDGTQNARAVNSIYEIARKSLLCECRWTHSTTRSTLATVATTAIAWYHVEEGAVYARPTDALKIWEMSDLQAIWREEGDYIISSSANLGAKYTFDQTHPSKWPPDFVAAFIDKLCSDISFMILNDAKKSQMFLEKYEKISLPKAKSSNSQVGSYSSIIDDEWTSAKFANGNAGRSYS